MTPEAIVLQNTPIITFGYMVQVFVSLLFVLAFIYVIARYLLPRFKINNTGNLIKIVDRVYLEPQVTAYILKVGKSAWLVMTGNKQVAKIDRLEDLDV